MLRWGAAAYALLGLFAFLVVHLWRGESAFVHPEPWLALEPGARHIYSALCGIAVGALLVVCTRAAVRRFSWARHLHSALRPTARALSPGAIVLVAGLSSFGEEL